jgi:hypothetical protein
MQRWQSWIPHNTQRRRSTRSQTRTYIIHSEVDAIPDDVVPISITHESDTIKIINRRDKHPQCVLSNNAWPIQSLTTSMNDPRIRFFLYNIILNNGVIFSDGSYDNGVASYAILAQHKRSYQSLQDIDFDQLLLHRSDM